MPTSFYSHIPNILDYIRFTRPNTILEIGCGFGKWGHLCREYLEVYDYLRWQKKDWQIIIDGVEIYKPYINEPIKYYYDHIYEGDITTLIDSIPDYDLIMMMDVLEHIEKVKGTILLNKIINKCKSFILSIPLGDWTYTFSGDNKNESHISIWNKEELIKLSNYKNHCIYPMNKKEIGVFYYERPKQ